MIKTRLVMTKEVNDLMYEIWSETKDAKKRVKFTRLLYAALTLFCIGMLLTFIGDGVDIFTWIYAALGVITLALQFFIKKIQRMGYDKKMKKMDPKLFTDREYEISEEGIKVKSIMGEGFHKWAAMETYMTVSHYIYVRELTAMYYLFDKNTLSREDTEELYRILKENIK